jgi:recombination protein RecR
MKLIDKLANCFSKLPGVGKKTANRYVYSVINMNEEDAITFAKTILEIKQKITYCEICGNFTEVSPCENCESSKNSNQICVVAYPKDVLAAEKIRSFEGQFHVLHGTLSPLDGRGPNDIRIKQLLDRIQKNNDNNIKTEVILATNTDVEGEATAMYIAKILKPLDVKVTRIAQGIAMGTELEYADEVTLTHAFNDRRIIG